MRDPMFNNKDGSLTVWAMVLGYHEIYEDEHTQIQTRMYADGDCYHVRQYDFKHQERVHWYTFTSIVEARKCYRRLVRASKKPRIPCVEA
jgi:hypothetical protein